MPGYGLGIGEAAVTATGAIYDTLLSGGASSCVIIAIRNPTRNIIFMVHVPHGTANLSSIVDFIRTNVIQGTPAGSMEVELASQTFGQSNAGDSNLVQLIRANLTQIGLVVRTEHASTSMSLNVNGDFIPGANAANASRQASDDSNGALSFKILSPAIAPLPDGRAKSKESPI